MALRYPHGIRWHPRPQTSTCPLMVTLAIGIDTDPSSSRTTTHGPRCSLWQQLRPGPHYGLLLSACSSLLSSLHFHSLHSVRTPQLRLSSISVEGSIAVHQNIENRTTICPGNPIFQIYIQKNPKQDLIRIPAHLRSMSNYAQWQRIRHKSKAISRHMKEILSLTHTGTQGSCNKTRKFSMDKP